MLSLVQGERDPAIRALMEAVAEMMAELAPERDHRRHWDTALSARRAKPDIFERIHWSCDELTVISAQMVHCQPWQTRLGRSFLEETTTVEQWLAASEAVGVFVLMLKHEADPLTRLENDVKAIQLQRRWYGNLRAAELPRSVRALRRQHDSAEHVVRLLGKIAGQASSSCAQVTGRT